MLSFCYWLLLLLLSKVWQKTVTKAEQVFITNMRRVLIFNLKIRLFQTRSQGRLKAETWISNYYKLQTFEELVSSPYNFYQCLHISAKSGFPGCESFEGDPACRPMNEQSTPRSAIHDHGERRDCERQRLAARREVFRLELRASVSCFAPLLCSLSAGWLWNVTLKQFTVDCH